MWYVYILKSLKNNRFYCGHTDDLKRRFIKHKAGSGGKFTHDNKPFKWLCCTNPLADL